MATIFPPAVAAFMKATADHDLEGFLSLFGEQSLLVDEKEDHRGDAIREWAQSKFIGGKITLDVLQVTTVPDESQVDITAYVRRAGEPVVTKTEDENGIPLRLKLDFCFICKGDGITQLTIVETTED